MIKQWNETIESLSEFKEKLEEFISLVPHSTELYKQKNILKKSWEKTQRLINEVDKFITPPESIAVRIPKEFNSDKFIEAWQFWKDYLEEQHSIRMRSRMEVKALKLLVSISDKNMENALEYLDYAQARGYKSFYKIDDNSKLEKKEDYDPDFNR